jgi:hypothetical protein
MQKTLFLTLFAICAFLYQGAPLQANEEQNEVPNFKTALQKEKEDAVLKADIAEAEKRESEAKVAIAKAGGGSTQPLDGTVTLNEGAGYFSEILAYNSLQIAAEEIAKDVVSKTKDSGKKIIITDQVNIAALSAMWNLVSHQIDAAKQQMKDTKTKFKQNSVSAGARLASAAAALPALSAGVSALADIIGYFREDLEISQYNVDLHNRVLIAEVAKNLKDLTVVIPSFSFGIEGKIVKSLGQMRVERNLLEGRLQTIETTNADLLKRENQYLKDIAKLKNELAVLEKADPLDLIAIKNKKNEIKAGEANLKGHRDSAPYKYLARAKKEIPATIKLFDDLVKSVATPPNEGEKAPIELLSQIDSIRANPDDLFLFLSIVGQGGEVQITKSIWTGGRISYIGGSTAVYFVTDKNGTLTTAGSHSNYLKAWYGQRGGVKNLKTDLPTAATDEGDKDNQAATDDGDEASQAATVDGDEDNQ